MTNCQPDAITATVGRRSILSTVRFLRHDSIFGAGARLMAYAAITAAAAIATFLTTPILVRSLGLEGFGSYSLVDPVLVSAASIALFGADSGVLKTIAYDGVELREAIGAVLPFILLVFGIVAVAISLLSPHLTTISINSAAFGILVPAEAMLLFLTTAFRASNRLVAFGIAQAGRAGLMLTFVVCLERVMGNVHAPVSAVIWIRLGVAALLVTIALIEVRPLLRFNWGAYRAGIRYGIFLVVTSGISAFQDNFDRYVIAGAASREAVGSYVVFIKVAAIVGQSVILPLMIWFPAERLRHIQDPDGGERFFRITAIVMLSLLLLVSGDVFLCGRQLVGLIGPGTKYDPSVLLFVLAAGVATGMAHPLNIGLFKPGMSHYNIYPVAIASIIGFVLARICVIQGGIASVAAVKAVAGLLAVLMIYFLSQRAHAIPIDFTRLASIVGIAGLLLTVLTSAFTSNLSVWLKIVLFSSSMTVLPAELIRQSLHRRSGSPVTSVVDLGIPTAADR